MHCSPEREAQYNASGTCYSKQALIAMAQAVKAGAAANKSPLEPPAHEGAEELGGSKTRSRTNAHAHAHAHSSHTVARAKQDKAPSKGVRTSGPKSKLWESLNAHFSAVCKGDEACWVETDVIRSSSASSVAATQLRPKMPDEWKKNMHTWLNNFDIEEVMSQYERKYPSYKFMGVFPIDFASPRKGFSFTQQTSCIAESMCHIDVAQLLSQGKKQVAAVLNLDRHDQRGSHWVAVYANFDAKAPRGRYGVFYYDSNAVRPPKEVVAFQEVLKTQAAALNKRPFAVQSNTRRHQFGNSECGVFSMHFIESMLGGATFEQIMKAKKYDTEMNKLRKVYYR